MLYIFLSKELFSSLPQTAVPGQKRGVSYAFQVQRKRAQSTDVTTTVVGFEIVGCNSSTKLADGKQLDGWRKNEMSIEKIDDGRRMEDEKKKCTENQGYCVRDH